MVVRGPRYSMEEFARRGDEIYNRDIQPRLKPEDKGKFVDIDIETGQWEMDFDDYAVVGRLYERIPTAQPWLLRVGYRSTYARGGMD